jgi:hypothetical protein
MTTMQWDVEQILLNFTTQFVLFIERHITAIQRLSTSRNKYLSNLCKSFCKGGELLVIHSLVDW